MVHLKKLNIAAAVIAGGIAIGWTAAPASAVVADPLDNTTEVYMSEMNLVSFDPDLAAANGYEIRTLDNGREYSVPIGTSPDFVPADEDTAPAPGTAGEARGTIWGDCGASWVIVTSSTMETGYNIKYDVAFGKWGVRVQSEGASFVDDFNLDHGSNGGLFDVSRSVSAEHYGYGSARVNDGSFAAATNGATCWSGNPQHVIIFQ